MRNITAAFHCGGRAEIFDVVLRGNSMEPIYKAGDRVPVNSADPMTAGIPPRRCCFILANEIETFAMVELADDEKLVVRWPNAPRAGQLTIWRDSIAVLALSQRQFMPVRNDLASDAAPHLKGNSQ